jgi:origin recognition complex subunit 1
VIAIANTFDLPERVMMRRVQSRLGLSRETFSPYTFKQLEEIVRSRLGPNLSRLFEDSGLGFIARKVASLSGDARRCLEICRQAVEHSIIRYEETRDPSSVYIRLQDVIKAVNAINCNPAILLMKTAPLYGQLLLRGTVASFRTSGIEEASVEEIIEHAEAIAHVDGHRYDYFARLIEKMSKHRKNLIVIKGVPDAI